MQYRFIRTTTRHEGRRIHQAGEVIELSGASLRHWVTRNAVEAIQAEAPPTPPDTEMPDATDNNDHSGDGSEPVAVTDPVSAHGAPAKKSGGNRRK